MRGTPANEFHHLDTETINITIRLQGNKLDSISNRLKSDTLNPGMAIFLSISYENLRKMRNFSKERDLFLTEIQKQKNVLDNLRHDLKENLVPENKGHEYCVKEITKYSNIEFKGYELWRGMTEAERKIDSLKDKIAVTNDSLYTE